MKRSKWIVAAAAAMVFDVQADASGTWSLSDFSTTTADSAETNAIYGYQTFANDSSRVTVNVSGQSVNLIASKIASNGTEGYTANFGLLLPLTPDWAEHDLTSLDSITFEYQNDAKITDVLSVSFGSSAYTKAIADAGTVFSNDIAGSEALKAGTTWKQGVVAIADFAPPSWWTPVPTDFPTRAEVLKHAKNLQFAPKTLYSAAGSQNGTACKACVAPTMASMTLKIRNIVLHGPGVMEPMWPNPPEIGCVEGRAEFRLDDFATGSKNTLGGDWFTISDFDSTGVSTDPSKGWTTIADSIHAEGPYLAMSAQLKKKVATSYHKYAGWAAIGTNFGKGGTLDATGLTGIGFQLADLGINPDRIQNIAFKVKMKGVDDTAVHQVLFPTSAIVAAMAAGKTACVRPSDLAQPSYVLATERISLDLSKIEQLSWEAKITDDRNAAIDTATANFLLANVVLYGGRAPVVGVHTPTRAKTSVGYSNGTLQWSGYTGASHFEIRRLDGQVVASFEDSRNLVIALPRGTYLFSATGTGSHYASKFTALGR
jgi:hypothetical protein